MKYIGLILLFLLSGCGDVKSNHAMVLPSSLLDETTITEDINMKLNVSIDDHVFTVTLVDNVAVDELIDHLNDGDITLTLDDYGEFEKVGALGFGLTTDNRQMSTNNGDIVLYNGNQIVLFFGSNSWSYTPLATIDDLSGWKDTLTANRVMVTLSLVR